MVECVLEGAREQLPLLVNGNETGTGVDALVAGQGFRSTREQWRDVDALAALGQVPA